jgi:hypothetical protein
MTARVLVVDDEPDVEPLFRPVSTEHSAAFFA